MARDGSGGGGYTAPTAPTPSSSSSRSNNHHNNSSNSNSTSVQPQLLQTTTTATTTLVAAEAAREGGAVTNATMSTSTVTPSPLERSNRHMGRRQEQQGRAPAASSSSSRGQTTTGRGNKGARGGGRGEGGQQNRSRHSNNNNNNNNNNQNNNNNNKPSSSSRKQPHLPGIARPKQKQQPTRRSNSPSATTSSNVLLYPPYYDPALCLLKYSLPNTNLIRGKLRVLAGGTSTATATSENSAGAATAVAFVACDRGSLARDVVIASMLDRNRALDGDWVYVELLPEEQQDQQPPQQQHHQAPQPVVSYEPRHHSTQPPSSKSKEQEDIQDGINKLNVGCNHDETNLDDHQDDDDDDGGDMIVMQPTDDAGDVILNTTTTTTTTNATNISNHVQRQTWQDDSIQMQLWNPIMTIPKPKDLISICHTTTPPPAEQRRGRVVYVIPPKSIAMQPSELHPVTTHPKRQLSSSSQNQGGGDDAMVAKRTIVGRLQVLKRPNADIYLLVPMNRSLPEFKCVSKPSFITNTTTYTGDDAAIEVADTTSSSTMMNLPVKAEYRYGSWKENYKWPPCYNVQPLIDSIGSLSSNSTVERETAALLPAFGVDHGDFTPDVLQNVDQVVQSGIYYTDKDIDNNNSNDGKTINSNDGNSKINDKNHHGELEWQPTPDMLVGRRDLRHYRIFTIDPTTARDLDDAMHIQLLPDGRRVEIGVHIADVSHFVQPDSAVDGEAERRATTVYLVDRVIPMLPRPLCEIACSLNENVDRLAFSCIWTMNLNGTLANPKKHQTNNNHMKEQDIVWYGRTVIRSCARLDYATAQNIIDGKVATDESESDMDESLWPLNRRPKQGGGHKAYQVASDVRLMHKVAMARRQIRFQNGALALNGIKLTFQLDPDGEAPALMAPYPIRDSNRLVEEYMLLANYLVAQKLATDAGELALLRHHPPPSMDGIQKVVDLAKVAIGFDIDATSSETLQKSLHRLSYECNDTIVIQSITALLTTPMQPALYFCVDDTSSESWRHFALHIPFYTHFTSPIRRYPDILVHRLLQATLDGKEALQSFPLNPRALQSICEHCNEKKEASRNAQQRGDIVFLALYLKKSPLTSQLGVVLSVGVKTFTVFVPSIGLNTKVFLDEHDKNVFTFTSYEEKKDKRIKVQCNNNKTNNNNNQIIQFETFTIKVFTKLRVTCLCKDKFPIDVKVIMEQAWDGA